MKIIRDGKVVARGVSQLMYVGDDEAVEKAVDKPTPKEVGVGVIAVLVASRTKGLLRLAAMGVAGWVGYKLYASVSSQTPSAPASTPSTSTPATPPMVN